MLKVDNVLLKSKFRGSLLGSLLGDCLGAPYEGDIISSGDKIIIQRYFDKLESDFKGKQEINQSKQYNNNTTRTYQKLYR